jgi:hypothetical protein
MAASTQLSVSGAPALPQPTGGGAPLDPATELKNTLSARVKLEEVWQKYQSDVTAAQDKGLAALASAADFLSFNTQMDQIIQTDNGFQAARTKKETDARWLNEHGVDLIKNNHKVAEDVEKDLGKSNQLRWFEEWEKRAAKPTAPAAAATAKAAKSRRRSKTKAAGAKSTP